VISPTSAAGALRTPPFCDPKGWGRAPPPPIAVRVVSLYALDFRIKQIRIGALHRERHGTGVEPSVAFGDRRRRSCRLAIVSAANGAHRARFTPQADQGAWTGRVQVLGRLDDDPIHWR
jgi:hypothetical protein